MEHYCVYVLYAEVHDMIYIGQTHNLENRIRMHNSAENEGWTKRWQPWIVIYQESCPGRSEAIKREKELKSYRGREFIRQKLQLWQNEVQP